MIKKMPSFPREELMQLFGHLTVTAYNVNPKSGSRERLFRVSKRNQITNDGRICNLEMLAQLTPPGATPIYNPYWNQIWSLGVGTDATPAMSTQTALLAPVWNGQLIIPTERVYNPALFDINVLKEVPVGDATGSILAEAGLFTRGQLDTPATTWEAIPDRRMYARQTYSPFEKGASMSVTYDWHLGLTVQSSP